MNSKCDEVFDAAKVIVEGDYSGDPVTAIVQLDKDLF